MAATRPIRPALDNDIVLTKPPFPPRQFVRLDGKGHVEGAAAIVGRNSPARQVNRFERRTPPKQQQHAATTDVESQKPLVTGQLRKPEHFLIKCAGPFKVVDIERRFDDTG